MTQLTDTIDHATLEKLAEAGTLRGAIVVGQLGGWGLIIQYGNTEKALAAKAKRGVMRIFKKFETLVAYLKALGIHQYVVDASGFNPSKSNRTDATERLKKAHQAAAYNDWLNAQVQEAIDDNQPNISHKQVMTDWQKQRAALLKQAESV